MKNAIVLQYYIDRETGKPHYAGEDVQLTPERFEVLQAKGKVKEKADVELTPEKKTDVKPAKKRKYES